MKKSDFIFKLFVNALMKDGKHVRADETFATALKIIKRRYKLDPYMVALRAIEFVKPLFELKARKVAAARYRIPYLLKPGRDYIFSARFILKNAQKRSEPTREQRLARELIDAARSKGGAMKQKKNLYDEVVSNRPYVKYMQ